MVLPTQDSPDEAKRPPYLATLKFQLKHLNVDSLRREDDSEDGIGRTSFPPRKSRAQSITLPLDMPVFGGTRSMAHRGVRRTIESSSVDQPSSLLKSETRFLDSLPRQSNSELDSNDVRLLTLGRDTRTSDGKWFNDIDKLAGFKAKYRLRGLSTRQNDTVKDWTASPKNFCKCILQQRQKDSLGNGCCGHTINPCYRDVAFAGRRVSFCPEVLLFSAIDENLSSELCDIITTHRIDVNSCTNAKGASPLHRAVEVGATNCVRVLLKNGADVNVKDTQGRPALDMAMRTGHFECLVLLVESGANIEDYTSQRLEEFKNVRDLSKTCYKSFEMTV